LYHLYSAVSDRTPWQDVLRIKSKLDSITEHIYSLQEELKTGSSSPSPSGAKWSSASPSQLTAVGTEPEEPFAYSSLKDWQVLTESDHRRQLYTCEAELLDLCERIILPKVNHIHHTDKYVRQILLHIIYI